VSHAGAHLHVFALSICCDARHSEGTVGGHKPAGSGARSRALVGQGWGRRLRALPAALWVPLDAPQCAPALLGVSRKGLGVQRQGRQGGAVLQGNSSWPPHARSAPGQGVGAPGGATAVRQRSAHMSRCAVRSQPGVNSANAARAHSRAACGSHATAMGSMQPWAEVLGCWWMLPPSLPPGARRPAPPWAPLLQAHRDAYGIPHAAPSSAPSSVRCK
jgi:hypothetical protein